jgi:hypothetical protein
VISDRNDRRTKRTPIKALVATHTPKHTHKSELKVISLVHPGNHLYL